MHTSRWCGISGPNWVWFVRLCLATSLVGRPQKGQRSPRYSRLALRSL